MVTALKSDQILGLQTRSRPVAYWQRKGGKPDSSERKRKRNADRKRRQRGILYYSYLSSISARFILCPSILKLNFSQ